MHACMHSNITTLLNNDVLWVYFSKITAEDPDGDPIRCRWAESSLNECADVCRGFPASLNGRDVCCITIVYNLSTSLNPLARFVQCEIQYTGSSLSTGDYAVALQVEDFTSSTATTPLSSVPVQFVVRIRAFSSSLCTSKPAFVRNTPLNGSYFEVPINTMHCIIII